MMEKKLEEVIGKMTEIALKKIKHYFTDFTKFDIPLLIESETGRFLWLVRDAGTYLINIDYIDNKDDLLNAYVSYSDIAYDIDLYNGKIKEIPCDINSIKKYYNIEEV